jgi:hypothetical protein
MNWGGGSPPPRFFNGVLPSAAAFQAERWISPSEGATAVRFLGTLVKALAVDMTPVFDKDSLLK